MLAQQIKQHRLSGYPLGLKDREGSPHHTVVRRLQRKAVLRGHTGCVNTLSYSNDGGLLVSGSDDHTIRVWDTETDRTTHVVQTNHYRNVLSAKFLPWDASGVVTGAFDGDVRFTKLNKSASFMLSKAEAEGMEIHSVFVSDIEFSSEFPYVVFSSHGSGAIKQHDLRAKQTEIIMRTEGNAMAMKFCPTQPHVFACADSSPYVKLFDLRYIKKGRSEGGIRATSRPFLKLAAREALQAEQMGILSGISGLSWSNSGTQIAANYNGADIFVFGMSGHAGSVQHARLLSKETDLGPFVYNEAEVKDGVDGLQNAANLIPAPRHLRLRGRVNQQTMCKNVAFFMEKYVVSGGDDGRVYLWDLSSKEVLRRPFADACVVNCVCPHPFRHEFAVSGINSTIGLWAPTASSPISMQHDDAMQRDTDGIDANDFHAMHDVSSSDDFGEIEEIEENEEDEENEENEENEEDEEDEEEEEDEEGHRHKRRRVGSEGGDVTALRNHLRQVEEVIERLVEEGVVPGLLDAREVVPNPLLLQMPFLTFLAEPSVAVGGDVAVHLATTVAIYRAHIFLMAGRPQNCLEDCDAYLEAHTDNRDIRALLLRCVLPFFFSIFHTFYSIEYEMIFNIIPGT